MVYPPLAEKELFEISFEGEGRYKLVYSVNPTGGKWEPIFSVVFLLPVGGIGATREEVTMHIPATPESSATARLMARMFVVPEDMGTPQGAVTLRGAWNFQTPPGWDTVYTPIFNMIDRPVAPMLVIRVETDWYVHDTEFRYVLQPGEAISASHSLPIGQVLFVPREEITLRDGTEEEIARRLEVSDAFFREKSSTKLKTAYGLEYSPHYMRSSRARSGNAAAPAAEIAVTEDNSPEREAAPPPTPAGPPPMTASAPVTAAPPLRDSPLSGKVGRNDPCPCGSGRKYKKCHGATS